MFKRLPTWSWIIGFFIVVFTMNGIMVYLATSTFGGVSTPEAYEKGLQYNKTLQTQRSQKALGWQHKISWKKQEKLLTLDLKNKDGVDIKTAKVQATFKRPTHTKDDQTVALTLTANGLYQSLPMPHLASGQWDVWINIEESTNQQQVRQRIFVK